MLMRVTPRVKKRGKSFGGGGVGGCAGAEQVSDGAKAQSNPALSAATVSARE